MTVQLDACPDLRDTAVLAVSSRSFAAFWGDLDDCGRPAKKESKK